MKATPPYYAIQTFGYTEALLYLPCKNIQISKEYADVAIVILIKNIQLFVKTKKNPFYWSTQHQFENYYIPGNYKSLGLPFVGLWSQAGIF